MFKKRQLKEGLRRTAVKLDEKVAPAPLPVTIKEDEAHGDRHRGRGKTRNSSKPARVPITELPAQELVRDTSLTTKPDALVDVTAAKGRTVRTSTAVDYQRDVCKDYMQTGYCGFGDTCKFAHVRESFALETELKVRPVPSRHSFLEPPPSTPSASATDCSVCKRRAVDPVRPGCQHLYCETCFFERVAKDRTCVVCGKDTQGRARPAEASGEAADLAADAGGAAASKAVAAV